MDWWVTGIISITMDQHNAKDTTRLTQPGWSIQTANWRDFSQLNQLESVCFSSDDLWPIWDLIGVLALPGIVRLKAVLDDHMIGFIGGERRDNRQVGWVTTLAVHPKYRRQGIALALLKKCEQTLDLPTIRLSVRVSNDPAIKLYEQHGYVRINLWKKYYAGGEDALVFEKRR
jgi:ribosomal-protein-alanine N-acetyltransferase